MVSAGSGDLCEALRDGPPVPWLQGQRLEDEEVERSLRKTSCAESASLDDPSLCFDKRLARLMSKCKVDVGTSSTRPWARSVRIPRQPDRWR